MVLTAKQGQKGELYVAALLSFSPDDRKKISREGSIFIVFWLLQYS